MNLLIATKNPGKFFEIHEVLHDLPIKLLTLKDIGCEDEVEETGETHEANALLKAEYFYKKTGLPTLAEDAGIYVDAFPEELGVKTRRFRDMHAANDEEWVKFFLKELEKVPDEKRKAKFVCHAVLILEGKPHHFYGECDGTITHQLEAPIRPGIPISSCFRPDGFDRVYAALSPQEKAKISHRGKAMHQAKKFLEKSIKKD